MTVQKTVVKIPSEVKLIKKVSGRIIDSIGPFRLDEAKLFDIRLCVEEAVRNSIVHGNRADKSRSVTVTFWSEGRKLIIEVEDEGGGFDYRNYPDPTSAENIMRNSGRGVYLIRHLMNEVEYNDTGSRIRMTKYL